jgi:phosphatidate cytidylyltransferase
MIQRILVAVILVPIGLALMYIGGPAYTIVIALVLGIAAWEYARLFKQTLFQPNTSITIAAVVALALGRGFFGFEHADWILSLALLVSIAFHAFAYERGREKAGTDFAITVSGIGYIGWIGAYLISLRHLPNGRWWLMVALPAVWLVDSGAYFLGGRFGRTPLSVRLSPNKTWEGYLLGILTGTVGSFLVVKLWELIFASSIAISPLRAVILGAILGIVTPLGDLGESMIKRQAGIKDSSNLIPGHGGAFDRIDSWLWGSVISYYLIDWFLG